MAAVKQAGTNNPLILLDEIDKLGQSFKGDPSASLLEVLDPEQNSAFQDHYIDLPFDLSHVLFVTTANDASAIPGPLYDRMDVITLGSYTAEEKFHIASKYLVPKQLKKHGIKAAQLRFTPKALHAIIEDYTREAGVRTLERTIGTICRKVARRIVTEEDFKSYSVKPADLEDLLGPAKFAKDKEERRDEIGLVNGLAWTSVGGELLPIEVAVMNGTGQNSAHRLARRCDEGIRHNGDHLHSHPRGNARHQPGFLREKGYPHPRAGGRCTEGRSVCRYRHGNRRHVRAVRRAHRARHRHDR